MDSDFPTKDEFEQLWSRIPNRTQLEQTETFATVRSPQPVDEKTRRTLPAFDLDAPSANSMFHLQSELGRGGMGIVHLARQAPMDRDVALKVPRTVGDDDCIRDLLREANVMGYLDHPNIVPVHVLGKNANGDPFVAMKRVEGETLADRLARGAGLDQLDDVIETLKMVCNALAYAHDRGIVHRDIKPSNIMIGTFGEVYLMDWGTAAAFREDVPDAIPRPDPERVVGTPIYLAPEMVGRPADVDPATDVYLLGGVLYATLTGRAPHSEEGGDSDARNVVWRAWRSDPAPLPEDIPEEIASICHRALSRSPDARFQTVEAFRDALADFQDHWAAQRFLEVGRERKVLLDALLEGDVSDGNRVYRLYGEARQAFEEADTIWPGNPFTQSRVDALTRSVIEYELERGDGAAAERLLLDLPEPDDELERRCARAVARQQADAEELQSLRKAVDPTHEARVKAGFLLLIGLVIGAAQLAPPLLFGVDPGGEFMMFSHLGLIGIMGLVSVAYRKRLFSTLANRTIASGAWMLVLFGFLLRLGVLLERGSLSHALFLDLGLVSLICAYVGTTVDRRVLFVAPAYAAFAIAAIAWPGNAVFIFPAAHTINLIFLAAVYYVSGRG